MKTTIITFRDSFEGELNINSCINALFGVGFSVDKIEVLPCNDSEPLLKSIDNFCYADNVIILDSENTSFDIKEVLKNSLQVNLVQNESAKEFATALSDDNEKINKYSLILENAKHIPNVVGVYQGYILDCDKYVLSVLPTSNSDMPKMIEKYVAKYLEEKFNLNVHRITLKYFGDKEKLLYVLEKSKEVSDCKFSYHLEENFGDFTLSLFFENYKECNGAEIVRYIVGNLKENIYAEYNVSLAERLFDILKLKKLKISCAESFTGGKVVSSIIENNGASEVVVEGIVCYSNQSKVDRVFVKKDDLYKEGAVSSIVAYEMASGLLKNGNCDIAVATTGFAGPTSNEDKPVGLCYIAVGMMDGVHTYKLSLKGNRKNITETAKNYALFLAIKKLKNYKEE